jgi:hypothetical protein
MLKNNNINTKSEIFAHNLVPYDRTVSPSARLYVWRILVSSIPLVYDGNRFLGFLYEDKVGGVCCMMFIDSR